MKKRIILLLLLVLVHGIGFSQSFLDEYKAYRKKEIKTVKLAKSRRLFNIVLAERLVQLDSVVKNHERKTGYNFNNADTINLIIATSIESNYSSVIIWNTQDTISYEEGVKVEQTGKEKKITVYSPFLQTNQFQTNQYGISISIDRDSLVELVSVGNFRQAMRIAKEHPVFDGASSNIIKAVKNNGRYFIRSEYLPPFGFIRSSKKK